MRGPCTRRYDRFYGVFRLNAERHLRIGPAQDSLLTSWTASDGMSPAAIGGRTYTPSPRRVSAVSRLKSSHSTVWMAGARPWCTARSGPALLHQRD
eukprot:10245810-Lingulodinium_polyedra.AAC.1